MRRIALLILGLLNPSAVLRAQVSAVTLRGRVVEAGDTPVSGATVSVNTFDAGEMQAAQTGHDGHYRVVMRSSARAFYVTVRATGYAPRTQPVTAPPTDSVVLVPDIRLIRSAQALPVVRVLAPRAPPVRAGARIGGLPGEDEQTVDASSGFTAAITGDVTGDFQSALAAIPGVAVTPSASGGMQFTIAGLDASQNRVTLNGADATPVTPRDGGALRVSTSSYDPAETMAGVRMQWIMVGGNYLVSRKLRLTFDPLVLQPGIRALATTARPNAPILSGAIAGPLGRFPSFHNTAFQVSRQATSTRSLATLDDASLKDIGFMPDSARRLLGTLDALGLAGIVGAPHQVSTRGSLYTRLDFTKESLGLIGTSPTGQVGVVTDRGDGRIVYVILGADGTASRNDGVGPLTLPLYGVTSSHHGFRFQAFHSVYLRRFVLNETRVAASLTGERSTPASALPAAAIVTSRADANDNGGILSVQAAGSGEATRSGRARSLQLMNETRWTSPSGKHEWKVAFEGLVDQVSGEMGRGRGHFEFSSIENFIASNPTSFTRALSATSSSVRGVHLGLGVGDSFSPSRSLAWQFGLRGEAHRLDARDAANQRADSVFGVRTGALPMRVSIAPMAGFTWKYRKNRFGYPSNEHALMGGIRDYRASVSTRSGEAILGGPGLGSRQLRCVGASTPKPDWARYDLSESSIPTSCVQSVGDSLLAQSAVPLALFGPSFALGHSVRAELRWSSRVGHGLFLTLSGMSAVNTHQPSTVDLNFNGTSQFRLASEAARPVFVPTSSISEQSGTAAVVASRRDTQFSSVNERRADVRSRSSSITATLNLRPAMERLESGIKLPLTVSYTWFGTHQQRNGFTGTTAGDPRSIEWQPSETGRHAVVMAAALQVPDWFRLEAGVQWRSGSRYTPTVLGDVNGDGLVNNDRAYVPDPAQVGDSSLRRGLTTLLASAPRSAQRCLRAQLGSIARPNSCVGPMSATANAVVTIDPARVGLQNRGAIRIRVNNVLAGIDQLLHGTQGLHGWGQPVYPDPMLLRITGFDAATQRFRYDVNRSFGDPRAFQRVFYSPFRVTIEAAIDLGPDREQAELRKRLAPASREGVLQSDSASLVTNLRRAHDPRNLFEPVLRRADEFQLTESQRDSLEQLGRRHGAFRDSAYAALASEVAAHGGMLTDDEVRRAWRETLRAVARFEWQIGAVARGLLTRAQADEVFSRTGPLSVRPIVFDARELERHLRLWQDRVF